MGAGGGMWASARDELRRPGLSGGGGGKPLLAVTGLGCTTGVGKAGGFATSAAFLLAATDKGLVLTGLTTAFGTGLETGLAATLAAALETTFTEALGVGFVANLALTTGFEATFLATGLALAAGLTAFFATGFATTLGADLAADMSLVEAFTAAFTTCLLADLPADAFGDLAGFLAMGAGLPAALFALTDFAGFAFTVCLLWDAASGWTPPPSPIVVSGRVFWSARDCSGCPACLEALNPKRWRIDTNINFLSPDKCFFTISLQPNSKKAQTRHCSRPCIKISLGRSMPINTILLVLVSPAAQAGPKSLPISWCTPWKITLRSVPSMFSTPL